MTPLVILSYDNLWSDARPSAYGGREMKLIVKVQTLGLIGLLCLVFMAAGTGPWKLEA
jgi:hypothetical protein